MAKCKKVKFNDVKPGDKVTFNDGREKVVVKIT